jgi:hypothetical protein
VGAITGLTSPRRPPAAAASPADRRLAGPAWVSLRPPAPYLALCVPIKLALTAARTRIASRPSLTRWEPFTKLSDLRNRLDRIFDEPWDGHAPGAGQRTFAPAIDVVRDNGDLVVRADVPGIKPEEVRIELDEDILTVSGEHEEEREEKVTITPTAA